MCGTNDLKGDLFNGYDPLDGRRDGSISRVSPMSVFEFNQKSQIITVLLDGQDGLKVRGRREVGWTAGVVEARDILVVLALVPVREFSALASYSDDHGSTTVTQMVEVVAVEERLVI